MKTWRPASTAAEKKFLACGDLKEGFARVRCPTCRFEFFVAFSCRRRCLCPSCHQKRALLIAEHVARDVCEPVGHRHFVFTIPKRLRLFFRFDRRLLAELPRLAWETVLEVQRAVLDRRDVTPGMIAAIHTFGQLLHFHPHLHALVTDGGFLPDGTFIPLPEMDSEPFEKRWQTKVFDLLLRRGKIDESLVQQMRSWQHSGFAVNFAVTLGPGDLPARERVLHYLLRCPFSLERLIRVTPEGKVLYRAEKITARRFPRPARDDLFGGVARNFQLFDPLDFIAELTQHVPDARKHLGRAFGFCSHKARGRRARAAGAPGDPVEVDDRHTPNTTHARRRWAALIKQVWRVDPLVCSRCHGRMKIVSFITPSQREVIEKILRHRGLWEESPRAPPQDGRAAPLEPREPDAGETRYVNDLEYADEPAPAEPVWTGH